MSILWVKAASGAVLMAAFAFGGGLAVGAPPRHEGEGDSGVKNAGKEDAHDAPHAAKETARDAKDTGRDTANEKEREAKTTAHDTAKHVEHKDASKTVREAGRDAKVPAHDQRSSTPQTQRGHRTTSELGLNLGRMGEHGVGVGKLASTSPIYRAGLRDGDFIVSINDHRLAGPGDFDRWAFAGGRNDRVKCIVWRNNAEEIIYLEPAILYLEETASEERPHFGIAFDDRYPDRVVIRSVYPDSPAADAGLREGDEIITWNGQRVSSPADFASIIKRVEPGTVNFEYLHDSKRMRGEARFGGR